MGSKSKKKPAAQKSATKNLKNSKNQKPAKKLQKKHIVAIVLAVILCLSIVGGLVTWIILSNREPEMSDWAEVYLTHIKTVREKDQKQSKNKDTDSSDEDKIWNDQASKPAVSFYESENNSPTMVVNYTSVENNLSYNSVAVYSIQNEEIYLLNYENTNLYYVYDIDMNTYNFYLKHENEDKGEDTYVDIEDYFKDPEADGSEYEKTCSTDERADDYCGDVYVEESVELPSFEYNDEMTNKELAEAVADTSAEAVTEAEVKQETEEKLQEQAQEAKERIKKKEEAKEFFMVGDQKVRFGKYESSEFDRDGVYWTGNVGFVLNPDFTLTLPGLGLTVKFEVRPIRHGDVPNTCVGESCPPYLDDLNGYPAIILEKNDRFVMPIFTKAESEKAWGARGSSMIPVDYDLMPAYGQMAVYYRFMGK